MSSASLTALAALVRKDVILYFSNRRAVVMSVIAPIAIAAFFGSIMGGDSKGEKAIAKVPIAVADRDGSALSKAVVAELQADPSFEVHVVDAPAALAESTAGKARAAVVLPPGFGASVPAALLRGGERPKVEVRYDPSQSATLTIVDGLLAKNVMRAVTRQAGEGRPAGAGPSFELPYETTATAATAKPEVAYNSYAHSFAGMGVQFILFMGIEVGVGVLLARRLGLWKRLRAAPLSRGLLLGSHIASGALIASLLLAVIYAAAIAFFGVRISGSVPGFIGVGLAFAVLTSSFGLLIAAIGKTPEATRGLAIFATLIMVMLGGAWVPTFIFPPWLQTASLAIPTRWAVDGLDAMTWRGLPFSAAIGPIVVMLGFALAFALVAVWRFDWEEPR